MATITTLSNAVGAGTHPSRGVRQVPYVVENVINLASVVTALGTSIASGDIVEALQIPAQSVVLSAGVEAISAVTGNVAISLGVTGVTAAAYVSSYALNASAAGTYATPATAGYPIVTQAADTVDLLFGTVTTAVTAGKLRVWAVLCDVTDRREIEGLSVDRDQLA
jgi:hypothetical protein